VESAGAKAPAITISIQPFIAGLEVLCHQTKDERGVFWQIPETSLARAAEIAGDEAKSRKAHADFSAIWKDADVGLPITSLKELL
jgi:hypothetical protein